MFQLSSDSKQILLPYSLIFVALTSLSRQRHTVLGQPNFKRYFGF